MEEQQARKLAVILHADVVGSTSLVRQDETLAHAVQARQLLGNGLHDEALAEIERAVALDPNDPAGLVAMANALAMAGRSEEAVGFIERAMRLDPHFPPSYLEVRGLINFNLEQFGEAAALLERALHRSPELTGIPLIAAYGHLGRLQEAREIIAKMEAYWREWNPGIPVNVRWAMDYYRFKEQADAERFADGLRKAGLQ